jgi:hypothetical protein
VLATGFSAESERLIFQDNSRGGAVKAGKQTAAELRKRLGSQQQSQTQGTQSDKTGDLKSDLSTGEVDFSGKSNPTQDSEEASEPTDRKEDRFSAFRSSEGSLQGGSKPSQTSKSSSQNKQNKPQSQKSAFSEPPSYEEEDDLETPSFLRRKKDY